MTAYLFHSPVFRPLNISGGILPGAKIQFYISGTTTPTDVYADAGLTTPLSNPVIADADGRFVAIYLDPTVTYRALLFDEDDALQWDIDPLAQARDFVPGTVLMFYGTEQALEAAYPPALWQQLDGNNGAPDIRDRSPIGVSTTLNPGDTGGSASPATTSAAGGHDHGGAVSDEALSVAQIPAHHHRVWGANNEGLSGLADQSLGAAASNSFAGYRLGSGQAYIENTPTGNDQFVEDTGSGDTHDHDIQSVADHTHTVTVTPPYLALYFIMRRAA